MYLPLFPITLLLCSLLCSSHQEPITPIIIDGNFDDWSMVPTHYDPDDNIEGTVLHDGIPDCHDTDHELLRDVPDHVFNPHANIIEFKFTHDRENLFAYFKTKEEIATAKSTEPPGSAGRYYVIVTLNVDQNLTTGYWLHEGGYYPTSGGYDINFEIEFYNGTYNQGDYLGHGANSPETLAYAKQQNQKGVIVLYPGNYSFYTEYVYWDSSKPPTSSEAKRCLEGPYVIPDRQAVICFSEDKAPGPFNSAVTFAVKGNELEYKAPFKGALVDPEGKPIIGLGKTLDVSFTMETSGELSTPQRWVSDSCDVIKGYYLDSQ